MHNLNAIKSAIENAERSIQQAKRLLSELEGGRPHTGPTHHSPSQPTHPISPSQPVPPKDDRPGIVGLYDGEKMVTPAGESYDVPGNYASKSLLVIGDTLKMYEENGEKRFKQVEHVKRHKTNGLLVKKEGKFRAITPEGSYKVLTESINHFKGDVGDEVVLYLPAGNLTAPYGAIETIHKKTPKEEAENMEIAQEMIKEAHAPVIASAAKQTKPSIKKEIAAPSTHAQARKDKKEVKEVKPAPAVVNPVVNEVKTSENKVAEPKEEVVPPASGEEELS